MLGLEGDGKVSEDLDEASPNGLALHLRILLALHRTRLILMLCPARSSNQGPFDSQSRLSHAGMSANLQGDMSAVLCCSCHSRTCAFIRRLFSSSVLRAEAVMQLVFSAESSLEGPQVLDSVLSWKPTQ